MGSRSKIDQEIVRRANRAQRLRYRQDGEKRTDEEYLQICSAEFAACKASFFYWIRNYGWLHDPHAGDPEYSIIPFMLWPKQKEIVKFLLSGLKRKRNRHLNKARSIGASWIALHICVHRFLTRKGFTAKLGSRKEEFVDNKTMDSLFGKLRFVLKRQPDFLKPDKRQYVDNFMLLQNGALESEISGEATNPGFGRGGRRELVLFDEFAHVEASVQSQAWTSLQTVQTSIFDISTPNGKGNQFHLNFSRAQPEDRMQADWRANPSKTQEWFDGLLFENGGDLNWDQRAQEHDCDFAGVGGSRVLRAAREKVSYSEDWLMNNYPEAREQWPLAVAGDVGSGPSLTSFSFMLFNWSLGDGVDPLVLVDSEVVRERQTAFDIARDVALNLREYRGSRSIFGDPASVGKDSSQESWESNLRSGGIPFSALPPWYNDRYAIKETLEDVQRLIDKGLFMVHERCYYVHECLESWEWNIPKGLTVDQVSKEHIEPKKNVFSHSGDSLRYGAGAIIRMLRPGQISRIERNGVRAPEELPGREEARLGMPFAPGANPNLSPAAQVAAAVASMLGMPASMRMSGTSLMMAAKKTRTL